MTKGFQQGFLKRAEDYGIPQKGAEVLLKEAGAWGEAIRGFEGLGEGVGSSLRSAGREEALGRAMQDAGSAGAQNGALGGFLGGGTLGAYTGFSAGGGNQLDDNSPLMDRLKAALGGVGGGVLGGLGGFHLGGHLGGGLAAQRAAENFQYRPMNEFTGAMHPHVDKAVHTAKAMGHQVMAAYPEVGQAADKVKGFLGRLTQ